MSDYTVKTTNGTTTDVAAAVEAGIAIGSAEFQTPTSTIEGEHIPFVVVPQGATVQSLEAFIKRDTPRRRSALVMLSEAASLSRYVNDFKAENHVQMFADWQKLTIAAVLDYHATGPEGAPAWGEHRAILTLRATEAWGAWAEMDGERKSQAEFIEFVEDNIRDIVNPDGATIFEIASSLDATKGLKFHQSTRLSDGQTRFTYHESIEASASVKGSSFVVPKDFELMLQPFEGSQHYSVTARLRYRVTPQGLAIGFDLLRPDLVVERAFNETVAAIEKDTSISVLRGTAPTWKA